MLRPNLDVNRQTIVSYAQITEIADFPATLIYHVLQQNTNLAIITHLDTLKKDESCATIHASTIPPTHPPYKISLTSHATSLK